MFGLSVLGYRRNLAGSVKEDLLIIHMKVTNTQRFIILG